MLSWNVSDATSLRIDHEVGSVSNNTALLVTPSTTTDYLLTASNANGTVTATTTVTVISVSRGGGGGSGGGEAILPTSPSPLLVSENPVSFRLVPYAYQEFTLGRGVHRLTITSITANTATMIIQSAPITITLARGQHDDIDVDRDGTADITVLLTATTTNSATISIRALTRASPLSPPTSSPSRPATSEQAAIPTNTTPPTTLSNTTLEHPQQLPSPQATPESLVLWICIISIVLLGIITTWHKRKHLHHQDAPAQHEQIPTRQTPLREYIDTMRSLGATEETIERNLLNAGWNQKDIEQTLAANTTTRNDERTRQTTTEVGNPGQ